MALLQRSADEKVVGASSVVAEALFYGQGVTRSSKKALAVLQNAAKEGDRIAAIDLIEAYRDGKRDGRTQLVKRDNAKAKSVLLASADLLSGPEKSIQTFLLDASTAKASAFAALSNRFKSLTQPERQRVVRDLARTNPRLFAYLIEAQLRQNGVRVGPVDGRLNAAAQRALARQCRTLLPGRQCNQGLSTPRVVETLAQMF
jgi:hypothetical protein